MRRLALFSILSFLMQACSSNGPTPKNEVQKMALAREGSVLSLVGGEAAALFAKRCATCHGLNGQGNGRTASNLPVRPRSFADRDWQRSVTDEHLHAVILGGGQAVGKSMLMPPNPDLRQQPATLNGLVQIIREFGKRGPESTIKP